MVRKEPLRRHVAVLATLAALGIAPLAAAPASAADVVVVGGRAPVRATAGVTAPVLVILPDGSQVELRPLPGPSAPWYRVVTEDGREGWIAGDLAGGRLNANEQRAGGPGVAPPTVRVHVPTAVRSAPALGRAVEVTHAAGTPLTVLEQMGTWARVADAGGRSGWIDLLDTVISAAPAHAVGSGPPETVEDARSARRAAREEREAAERAQREARDLEHAAERERRAAEDEADREARRAEADERAAERERARLERRRRGREERAERRAAREAETGSEPAAAPAPPSTSAGAVAPADIPPAVEVDIPRKPPSERRADPQRSPVVGAPLPAATAPAPAEEPPSSAPSAPAPSQAPPAQGLPGFTPFDEAAQRERAVEALHAEAGGVEPPPVTGLRAAETLGWINARGEVVPTRIVTQVVARVNDEIVTTTEFLARVAATRDELERDPRPGRRPPTDEEIAAISLRRVVDDLLLIDDAKHLGLRFDRIYERAKADFMEQAGIRDDLELLQLLDATGRTWDDFRREIIRRFVPAFVIRNRVFSQVVVPEADVEDYYRRHQAEWAEEDCVRLSEIVLLPRARENTRDFNVRLDDILRRLEAGEDFCDLASRHSEAPSAAECGLLPQCFTHDQLDQKAARVAFRMRPGDVEPIRTEWGYHVLRLEEHRPRAVRTLEEVRDEVLSVLRRERSRDAVRDYVGRLRDAAFVYIAPQYRSLYDATLDAVADEPSAQ